MWQGTATGREIVLEYENLGRTWCVSSNPGQRTQRYVQKEKAINQIQSGLINWALSIFLEERREGRDLRGDEICSPSVSDAASHSLSVWPMFAEGDIPAYVTTTTTRQVELWGKENKEQNRCPKTMMVSKIVKRRSKKKIYSRYRIKATICHR